MLKFVMWLIVDLKVFCALVLGSAPTLALPGTKAVIVAEWVTAGPVSAGMCKGQWPSREKGYMKAWTG